MKARRAARMVTVLLSTLALAGLAATPSLASSLVSPAQQRSLDPAAVQAKLDRVASRVPNTVAGWYVDPTTRQLVIEAIDARAARSFLALAGAQDGPVRVAVVAEMPKPLIAVRGGGAIFAPNGQRCSAGFTARNSAGTTFVLTAGHCARLTGTWKAARNYAATGVRTTLGPASGSSFPDNDYGRITITNTAEWQGSSLINGGPSVRGSTPAGIGAQVCRSGSSTGYRCGKILAVNQTTNFGSAIVRGMVRTNACSQPGDSGGAFITPGTRQAQGIASGGSGNCAVGGITFYQPVNEALQAYGLKLITG